MSKPHVIIIEALRDFRERHKREKITPTLLVDDVRNHPENPLYERFTWDDGVAAEAHRIEEAKTLLRIKVELVVNPMTTLRVPFMIRDLRPDRAGRSEYLMTAEVLSDPESARLTMIAELQQIRNKVFRAHQISAGTQFDEITAALAEVLGRIDEIAQEAEEIDPAQIPPQKKGGRRRN